MKKLIVAGIVCTMLVLTTSAPANARDRFVSHRPGVSYAGRYVDRGHSYADRGYRFDRYRYADGGWCDSYGCTGVRYPWPMYEGYRRSTYNYRW
jgi:hypothetical protein